MTQHTGSAPVDSGQAPQPGDRVVYDGPADVGRVGTSWARRRVTPMLVVGYYGTQAQVFDPASDLDFYYADPGRLRVVERATYIPVPPTAGS